MLVLRGLTGELRGQEFAVPGPSHWILGRSRSCSLRLLGDATVSRQHCMIEVNARGAWVQDLGSLNGTHVNGEKISVADSRSASPDGTAIQAPPKALSDGDELRICNTLFAVCLSDVESPAKEPKRSTGSSHSCELVQSA
jgi:pSer/pThr/pTyr-binding forkhead associated (FHA) protein